MTIVFVWSKTYQDLWTVVGFGIGSGLGSALAFGEGKG